MDRMDRVIATRVRDDVAKRLDALAKRETRKVGAMVRILLEEALNARECTAAIKQACGEDQRALREIYKELGR